jgi:hypothetical protein
MTIADLSQLVVETDVDEAYATQIRVDMPAVMQLAGETADAMAGSALSRSGSMPAPEVWR